MATDYSEEPKCTQKGTGWVAFEIIPPPRKKKLIKNEDDGLELLDVNKALNVIGDKCKKILLLIAEQYEYKEISEKLSIPIGTTMSRLLRCRKQLHQQLYGSSQYNEI